MCDRNELEQLEQLLEKSKQLAHSSEIKVQELKATIRGIQETLRIPQGEKESQLSSHLIKKQPVTGSQYGWKNIPGRNSCPWQTAQALNNFLPMK